MSAPVFRCKPLPMANPRILLADDHQPLLESVRRLLDPSFEVVGIACTGRALISEATRLKPDVIVVDISMPDIDGIEAVRQLFTLGSPAKIVFLTVHPKREFVKACVAAGGLGYVVKTHLWTDLIPAIEAAIAGRSYISPDR